MGLRIEKVFEIDIRIGFFKNLVQGSLIIGLILRCENY